MEIITKEPNKNISVRIPKRVYERGVAIAQEKGVKPANVWRTILVSFFEPTVNKSDTDTST